MRETLQVQAAGTLRAALALFLTLAVNLPVSLHAQTKTIGSVSDIDDHGNWFFYKDANSTERHKLGPWQDVPAGAVIRIESPKSGDHIAIVDTNLKPLIARKCESVNSCSEPIFLPRELAEAPSVLSVFYRKVLDRLSAEPYEPSMHRTRAAGLRLDEGVVALASGQVDLRKVMRHAPWGKYSLASFDPHAPLQPGAKAPGAVNFEWSSRTTLVPLGNRKPGLYEISLLQAADADSPVVAVSVRALVCSSRDYGDLSAAFQQAVVLTQQWVTSSNLETHSFLRAYLAELTQSRQIAGKP